MGRPPNTIVTFGLLSLLLGAASSSAQGTRETKRDAAHEIARHGAWTVSSGTDASGPVCFATTQPKSTVPGGLNRDQAYVYISAWPREGVKAEVSIASGFALRRGSMVTLTVGAANFGLFVSGDRAFVADPTSELKLIDAMKKATTMMVKSIDDRGMIISDTYSVGGLTQTLAAINQGCK